MVVSVSLLYLHQVQIPVDVVERLGGQDRLAAELVGFGLGHLSYWDLFSVGHQGHFDGDLLLNAVHDVVAMSDDRVHRGGSLLVGVDTRHHVAAVLRVKVRPHSKGEVFIILDASWHCLLSALVDLAVVDYFHHLGLAFNIVIFFVRGLANRSRVFALKLLEVECL